MLEQSWLTFRAGLHEIGFLLDAAQTASNTPTGRSLVTEQQAYTRAAIVLLAAHLEGFFKSMSDDYTDEIDDKSWKKQSAGVQRFIALQAIQRLQSEFEKAGACDDADKRESVQKSVTITSRWFKDPSRVGESRLKPRLRGFYRQRGSQAVENFLSDFHPNQIPFFDWLASKKFDRSTYWTVLQGLVNIRNDITHGDAQMSLTLAEVRRYVAVCTVLVRQVRLYVS